MEGKPNKAFGRRVPAPIQPAAPVKRSGHVALLLMGTFAVGGGAYGLMQRADCQPQPGMATPAASQAGGCPQGSSYGGSHGGSGSYYSRRNFFSSQSSGSSSSGSSSESSAHGVTRGGFGSFAHAISAHFSGGG
jgi:hypothetical protein